MPAKIMIVEDEGIEALSLQQKLKARGYNIPDIVYTGEDAVKKVAEICPDLVLMDIMLHGGMDGITAAEKIHGRFDIPIIYITAYADENTLQRAKITEPYGYIVKPFKERELQISIEMALYKHRTERELKESRRLLETTLKSIVDGVIATDKTGLITFMNPVAERLIGLKQEEVLKKELMEVFKIINRDTRKPAENPVTRAFEGCIVCRENNFLLIAKDGKEMPIEFGVAPIKDDNGNSLGVILVFCEVTKREKMQAALRESEERLRIAKEAALLGIYDYDLRRGTLRWDERVRHLWGVGANIPITHEVFLSGLHPYDRVKTQAAMDQALDPAGNGRYYAEYRVVNRTDSIERWVAAMGQVFFEQGHAMRLVGAMQDITERKRAEEQLIDYAQNLKRSNEDLEQFAYVSSHDLQEPLRTIVSFTQLLEHRYKGKFDDDADEFIQYIVNGGKRMQNLINDLLEFSRVTSKGRRFTMTNVASVVDQVEANLHQEIVESATTISHDPMPTLVADSTQLAQIFQNLIGNAIKFRREDPPKIHIGAEYTDHSWQFSVRDNGIGIAPEYFDKIFIIFQRLHNQTSYNGTGIGLALVKRIIDRHGGRVWVESEIGKGSTFYFTIPDMPAEMWGGGGGGG